MHGPAVPEVGPRSGALSRDPDQTGTVRRCLFNEDHEEFRRSFRRWLDDAVVARNEEFERAGIVDRAVFTEAGKLGFLGLSVDSTYGGGGVRDFRFNVVISEEIQDAGVGGAGLGLTLQNDICLPYFEHLTTDEQKARWLPGIVSGEAITAVAMTEPAMGSDLASMATSAVRDGDTYVVNGSKTFITNGINADLVIVAVKTDTTRRHDGISLLVVERGTPGFDRGRNLDKIGLHAQDTAELFFTDARVPVENRLGEEGMGFRYLVTNLPQERLSLAVAGLAAARAALRWTLDYVRGRNAFGQPVGAFQNTRFRLAELATEVSVAEAFVDRCVVALDLDQLTAEEAAMAKWWCTELQKRAVDVGVQLHGGYGYMAEYPIGRAYVDARVTTIFGGTTEIMKEIIGRGLGL
jgi:alkylation response protein AidB-like acyl-CoA dehydrogenase